LTQINDLRLWADDMKVNNPLTVLTVTHAVNGIDMKLVHGNYPSHQSRDRRASGRHLFFDCEQRRQRSADTLGAASAAAGSAMIHRTVTSANGVVRMGVVGAVELAPGARVTFGPAGYHVMLIGPGSPQSSGAASTSKTQNTHH
jgi:copper(I)-binding protein